MSPENLNDDHRDLLAEANELERRRVEITALAIEGKFADLLPDAWAEMMLLPMRDPVKVCFDTGLTLLDAERMTERECRHFVAFVGELADGLRQ